MSSRRDRVPLSGRSNLSARGPALSSRAVSARSDLSEINTARKEKLNDPLEVFRPYSPEVTIADSHLQRPPILPRNRHATAPPIDPTLGVATKRRGSICPDGFIEKNLAPNWFETVDQKAALLDVESKVGFCRDFIERNRDRLWKFDLKYRNMDPKQVADDMISQPGLLSKMKKYNKIERALKLSSSEQFHSSYQDDHLGSSKAIITSDPYLMTYNTPRSARHFQMTNLMTNNHGKDGPILQHGRQHQRGYKHTTGFGNFSNFNGLLQLNKNCALNR